MKLLILGGTIFLGRHLVESARTRGHDITLFNRGLHGANLYPDIETVRGDRAGDLNALQGRHWDAVIDTNGYVPSIVQRSAHFLKDAVKHYLFISSISVYANFRAIGMDETAAVETLTPEQVEEAEQIKPSKDGTVALSYGAMYGPLKALCEQTIENCMPGRVCTIRPGLITGPYDYSDRFTYWVTRIAQGGEVLAPGNPDRQVQLIDARDLADWTIHMVETGQYGTYNATGPASPLTMREIVEACKAESESDATFTWLNDTFLLEQGATPWSQIPLWLPDEEDSVGFSQIKVQRAIAAGLHFRPLTETIRDTRLWDAQRSPAEIRHAGLKREDEQRMLETWHLR